MFSNTLILVEHVFKNNEECKSKLARVDSMLGMWVGIRSLLRANRLIFRLHYDFQTPVKKEIRYLKLWSKSIDLKQVLKIVFGIKEARLKWTGVSTMLGEPPRI